MGIFYREKAFHAGKKIRKNDFAPSEKYASYAPDRVTFVGVGKRRGGSSEKVEQRASHCRTLVGILLSLAAYLDHVDRTSESEGL